MGGDQVLERQEGRRLPGGTDGHEPGDVVGDLDPCEVGDPGIGVTDGHGQVQRQPADVGKRVRRVDRQRGEHGEDLVAEVLAQPAGGVVLEVLPVDEPDALVLQAWGDVLEEHVRVPLHEVLRPAGDEHQLLLDGQAVGGADGQPHLVPPLEPGDAHHEELVEVPGEDRQELHPLEQGQRLVLGEFEHPCVEVQPGQLPVEEAVDGKGPERARGGHDVMVPHQNPQRGACRSQPPRERGDSWTGTERAGVPQVGGGVDVADQARPVAGQLNGAAVPVRPRRVGAEPGQERRPVRREQRRPRSVGAGRPSIAGPRRPPRARRRARGRSAGRSDDSAATAGRAALRAPCSRAGLSPRSGSSARSGRRATGRRPRRPGRR